MLTNLPLLWTNRERNKKHTEKLHKQFSIFTAVFYIFAMKRQKLCIAEKNGIRKYDSIYIYIRYKERIKKEFYIYIRDKERIDKGNSRNIF